MASAIFLWLCFAATAQKFWNIKTKAETKAEQSSRRYASLSAHSARHSRKN